MKALITAAFDEQTLSLLRPCLEVTYEPYRKTGKIYHDADEFIEKIRREQAEVLVVEADLEPYDVLPLVPVIEGAGGRLTDWEGRSPGLGADQRMVVAGDPRLHERAIAALAGS